MAYTGFVVGSCGLRNPEIVTVSSLGCRASSLGFIGFRASSLGFRVQGLGLRF